MQEVFICNILRNFNFINEQFIHYAQNDNCVKFNIIAIKERKKLFDINII